MKINGKNWFSSQIDELKFKKLLKLKNFDKISLEKFKKLLQLYKHIKLLKKTINLKEIKLP